MRNLTAAILLIFLSGCGEIHEPPKDPPPPVSVKVNSSLSIKISNDGSSDFSFSMHTNARTSAEAIQKSIRHLQDRLIEEKTKVEADDPHGAPKVEENKNGQ